MALSLSVVDCDGTNAREHDSESCGESYRRPQRPNAKCFGQCSEQDRNNRKPGRQ
jgi:hypothetical protein